MRKAFPCNRLISKCFSATGFQMKPIQKDEKERSLGTSISGRILAKGFILPR